MLIEASDTPGALRRASRLPDDSAWELCIRIAPIVIAYGTGRLFLTEHNSSVRLLKDLHRLARKGVRIRGVICEMGSLDTASVRALNCYLQHYYGSLSRRQLCSQLHRHSWYDFQRAFAARWVR